MNGRIGNFWELPKNPDEDWLQCDTCLKWRHLTKTNSSLKEADTFTCSMLELHPTERQKEKADQTDLPDACKVPQVANCMYSKIVFLATEGKKRKIPVSLEPYMMAKLN